MLRILKISFFNIIFYQIVGDHLVHSWTLSLGALLNTPILELNLFPLEMSYALKENDLYVLKIIYDNKNFYIIEIFGSKIRFFNSPRQYANRNLKFVENTEEKF